MAGYSIVILICSTALSPPDCLPKTALDVVRGPEVDDPVMCAFNAQTIMGRTDLVDNKSQYMKVVCAPSKGAQEWRAEIEAQTTTLQ
jgi:hypothetical protein